MNGQIVDNAYRPHAAAMHPGRHGGRRLPPRYRCGPGRHSRRPAFSRILRLGGRTAARPCTGLSCRHPRSRAFTGISAAEWPRFFTDPGRMVLSSVNGHPAGVGVLKPVAADEVELKRLYVRPRLRGRQLGRRMLDLLIAEARTLGFRRMRLETFAFMKEAVSMYRSVGFIEVPPFDGFEGASHGWTRAEIFMNLDLRRRCQGIFLPRLTRAFLLAHSRHNRTREDSEPHASRRRCRLAHSIPGVGSVTLPIERGLAKTFAGHIHWRACGQSGPAVMVSHINQQSSAVMVELLQALGRTSAPSPSTIRATAIPTISTGSRPSRTMRAASIEVDGCAQASSAQ